MLSPRQEILPAPYALSLRPGADVVGEDIAAGDAILAGYAPATGTALYADATGGVGLFGTIASNHGVQGSSNEGWGGYFTSESPRPQAGASWRSVAQGTAAQLRLAALLRNAAEKRLAFIPDHRSGHPVTSS